MKARLKPMVVDVWHCDLNRPLAEWPGWLRAMVDAGTARVLLGARSNSTALALFVSTTRGEHSCLQGDWLVRDANGHLYPLTQNGFAESFELLEDEQA